MAEGVESGGRGRALRLATMALSAVLAAGSNLALRHAMGELSGGGLDLSLLLAVVTSPFVILGIAGYAASYLLWLYVLSQAQLVVAYPVYTSSLVVLVLIGSILLLGEQVTLPRLGTVALVTAGIVVAEWGGSR